MSTIGRNLRAIAGVLTGSALYVVLNWVPFIGPFLVGFTAGKISRASARKGFLVGVFSGLFGFAFLLVFVFPRWTLFANFFMTWIMLLWNLFAIVISGIGGSLGSLASVTSEFFSNLRAGRAGESSPRVIEESPPGIFLVCPRCGGGNREVSARCKWCGETL